MSSSEGDLEQSNPKSDGRDFLNRIIFRLDFSTDIDASETKRKAFSSAIEEEFSSPQVETRKKVQFTIGEEGSLLSEGQTKFYHFTNKDGTRKVILEPRALVVLFFPRINQEGLLPTLKLVAEGFNKAYEKMTVTRTGLRYSYRIDRLEGGSFDWNDLISKYLTSPIEFYRNTDELARVMIQIELTKEIKSTEENYRVILQAGLQNSIDHPNPITSKEFVLDYDCFTVEDKTVLSALGLVDTFSIEILDLFNASITDGLRGIMGVKENA
jgi:uncharacterized protein (TIGR04255 family)